MNEKQKVEFSKEGVDIASCDTFEFMANVIGLPILHPGGLQATDDMVKTVEVNENSRILDVACGKGTSACYLVKKYGCTVVGVDIDERLISQAKELASRKRLAGRAVFQVADAKKLPFADDEFDTVLFQAVLIMVEHPDQVLREAVRVLKPGGKLGGLELTWKKQPSSAFSEEAKRFCAFFQNVRTAASWKELVFARGLMEMESRVYDMACPCTLRELGWWKALGIASKRLFHADIRKRMKHMDLFIQKSDEYFGYGIYVGKKSNSYDEPEEVITWG